MNDLSIKETLQVIGYPRSGNTFLAYVLRDLYFPEEEINKNIHVSTEIINELRQKSIVPIREPLDSIASWFNHGRNNLKERNNPHLSIESCVLSYMSFYVNILNFIEKSVLLDFNIFNSNIQYIKTKVESHFLISTESTITKQDIIDKMIQESKDLNLPNETNLEEIKEQVLQNEYFTLAEEAYQDALEAHDLQS